MCKQTKPGKASPAIVRAGAIVSTFSRRAAFRAKLASVPHPRHSAGSRCFAAIVTLTATLLSSIAWGQSYNWNNANTSGGGGFIPGIVFNPSQKNLVYVRTDIGGAYRWDSVNQRWIPLMDWVGFDDWNTLGMESIATDPVDPTRFYTASVITYQFGLSSGQTLGAGTGWLFDAQMSGTGTAHPTSGDTFTITYTIAGNTFTQSGHF